MKSKNLTCPLCILKNPFLYHSGVSRTYFQCPGCHLVFVDPQNLPTPQEEKAVYDLHQNSPDDERYRGFLNRLFDPVSLRLKQGAQGLDFGCGPGPTLSVMFEEAGFAVDVYDPFYAPKPEVFERSYDFITLSEVIEHVHAPKDVLPKLWRCLNPGGVMGVMTQMVIDQQAFASWHYKNDPTHVCFYSQPCFEFVADSLQATLDFINKDVVLLTKSFLS